MYYTNSEAKTTLESWYQANIGSKADLAKNVASGNYYCEQAKTKAESSWISGNANMILYSSYTPDFKCATDGNGKGIVNANIGLLTYDEVVYAGGYCNQINSNYYLYNSTYFLTISPAGFDGSYARVWDMFAGPLSGPYVSSVRCLRPDLILNADTKISSGDGTKENPFTIQ